MNGAATSETIHSSTKKTSAPWLSYVVFTLYAGLYLMPFMRVIGVGSDEGSVIYAAVRVFHGQVFTRDFFEVMGPVTPYFLAAFFKLFGVTFLATRVCLFITSVGTGLLMYFLTRRVCWRYQWLPCIILASTYFGGFWPGISHHVDSNFLALLSVACVVLWQERHCKVLLILSGVLAGLTTCFFLPKGVLLLVAIVLWVWIQRQRGAASISEIGLVVGGYHSAVALVLAYFWSQGALGSLVFANIIWPSRHYEAVNAVPYGQGIISWNWVRFIPLKDAFNWPISAVGVVTAVILITPLLFVAALPALVPISALIRILSDRDKWRIVTPEIVLYVLCGSALWLSEIHRKDINHLVFGSPLLIILCIYFLDSSRMKSSAYTLQLIAICAFWLATFNLLGVVTAHPVMTRVGSVAMFKDDPVLAIIHSHTVAGEEMYVYPYSPLYYFLSSTTNPTRYSLLLYNYNTDAEFYDAIRSLELRRPRYVIWDAGLLDWAKDFFPTANLRGPSGLIMEPYLESHYKLVIAEKGVRIMERKEADPGK